MNTDHQPEPADGANLTGWEANELAPINLDPATAHALRRLTGIVDELAAAVDELGRSVTETTTTYHRPALNRARNQIDRFYTAIGRSADRYGR